MIQKLICKRAGRKPTPSNIQRISRLTIDLQP